MKNFEYLLALLFLISFNANADEAELKENLKGDTTVSITAAIDSYSLYASQEPTDHFYKQMCKNIHKATVLMEQSIKYGIDIYDGAINLAVSQLNTKDLRTEFDGRKRTINLIQSDLEHLYSDKCE